MATKVSFKTGTAAQYAALETKDEATLYYITDTQEVYKGETLYSVGMDATASTAGLMSAEDKEKLDGITVITAYDGAVSAGYTGTEEEFYSMLATLADTVIAEEVEY